MYIIWESQKEKRQKVEGGGGGGRNKGQKLLNSDEIHVSIKPMATTNSK